MASAPQHRISLLCELGWHRPRPLARWNDGYYFTTCSRCGRDLVRTTYGGWQEPHGYRVVWQAHAPVNGASASLVRENGESASSELPIQEVLRHLQNGDSAAAGNGESAADEPVEADDEPAPTGNVPEEAMDEGEPAPEEAGPEEPAPATRAALSVIPDFMEDTSAWRIPPHTYVLRPAQGGPARGYGYSEAERGPGPFSRLKSRLAETMAERARRSQEDSGPGLLERSRLRFADLLQRFRSGEPLPAGESEPATESEAPARWPREMHPAFVMAIPIALLLVVLIGLVLWGRIGSEPIEANVQRAVPISPDQGQPAFVTASVLNCRSAPARQADSVAVLVRGDPVRLLARDGEWMSLVHEGGQCWALSRYFSIQEPM